MNARVRPSRMLVVALGWGSCFPLLDWGVRGSSVLWFVTWRSVIAGLVLLCGVAVRRRGRGDRVVSWSFSMWGLVAALAILNVTVGFAAMAATVTAVTAGVASVLGNAQALLVVCPRGGCSGSGSGSSRLGVAVGFGGLMLVARGSTGSVGAEALGQVPTPQRGQARSKLLRRRRSSTTS